MTVRSLFFASYRDLVGTGEISVELPASATVAELVEHLRTTVGPLRALPPAPAVAINMTYAPLSACLEDGDEVAFIPPVAGG